MKVQIATITPVQANNWLNHHNTHNRKLDEKRAQDYAEVMKSGNWRPNSTISFDRNGVLLDGQTRLRAVVLSGRNVDFVVHTELEPDAQFYIDTGRSRSDADAMRLKFDVANSTLFTSSLAAIRQLTGKRHFKGNIDGLAETYEEYRIGLTSILRLLVGSASKPTRRAAFVATMALARSKYGYAKAAEEFVTQVATGVQLSAGSPAYYLRNYLIGLQGGATGGSTTADIAEKTAAAFYKFCKGNTVSKLRLNTSTGKNSLATAAAEEFGISL